MKVKKIFYYDGIELRIVERDEPYMNATVKMIRVMAPNTGIIPIKINHKETLKDITQKTIECLDDFKSRGADIKHELTKKI